MRARLSVALLAVALGACTARPFDVHPYSGRCGDPPHGTAYRVFSCELMHDDVPSGGKWRWFCDP